MKDEDQDDGNHGVIGCGMMGREHLQNIALLEGARVGAIYEPDAGIAAAAAAHAGRGHGRQP